MTFLTALRGDALTQPCIIDGPSSGIIFRAYVEQFLAPTLRSGDIVILIMSCSDTPHEHLRMHINRLSTRTGQAWKTSHLAKAPIIEGSMREMDNSLTASSSLSTPHQMSFGGRHRSTQK